MARRQGRISKTLLGLAGLVLLAAVLFHFAYPPVYEFPPAHPFSGAQWYNPYDRAGSDWLVANFHAHSRTWLGFDRGGGAHALETVWNQYRAIGYDVIGISNYQSIRPPMPGETMYVTAYEHGYGIFQQHQTVLGAPAVSWFDFPLYQGTRHKQCVIDRLRADAAVVVINHPNKSGSYTLDDFRRLARYTGVELASLYARGLAHWDAALSAGRPVWGFCSDDYHEVEKLQQDGVGWLMVAAASRTPAALLAAIREGRFYSVWARQDRHPNELETCRIRAGRLEVELREPASCVRFIGQEGTVRAEFHHRAAAGYPLAATDTYLRVEAVTRATTLFLNPVFRHDGEPLAHPAPRVAVLPTLALRLVSGVSAALGLLGLVLFLRAVSGRGPDPRAPRPAAAPADTGS
ncbi:MAG: hypothetical protein JXQ29_04400 [Planctomycetes bacterium]|nr:hypothetical protein [Planctomycetota bacterium]